MLDKLTPTLSTPAPRKKAGFTHESTKAATVEWYTPAWVIEHIGIERYSMDVCSPGGLLTHIPADIHLTIKEDGLATPWHGTVWMNPPYTGIDPWMKKLAEHGDGIALVFARPDTKWFQAALVKATVVCFISGRIRFIDGRTGVMATGTPGAGSVLLAFGDTAAEAVLRSGLGVCVRPTSN